MLTANALCPCGSQQKYSECCEVFHKGTSAPTAEALMRSRYTAFVLEIEPYLLTTWHPSTCPAALNLATETSLKWLGLQVKHYELLAPNQAIVEFVARYRDKTGRAHRLHEVSQFLQENGYWYYVQGELQKDF